jgi:glycine cleavage system aminomethyltransferase T
MKDTWYPLAKRLAKEARYNGRSAARALNWRELNDHEYESWDGEMYRMINKSNRDYIGRDEEAKDLDAVLKFLQDIVQKTFPC